jgi:hypothetical protein
MDDLRAPAATWGHELQTYEREKRRVVDEGLVHNKQVRVTGSQVKLQERLFDPLLQRYRDNSTELNQRTLEERERVNHLNRSYDISILRGQPINIITHESKLDALAPGQDPMRLGHEKRRTNRGPASKNIPPNGLDYNIVSNLPQNDHHWAHPDARPPVHDRLPKERQVPRFMVKDFNIVNNRYSDNHSERIRCDKRLNLLEATKKYNIKSKFDPVMQTFNDPRIEERARTCDDAREVELVVRAENAIPPSYKGRQSQHYDMVSHQIHDPQTVQLYDTHEAERKSRYKNRYTVEHNFHKQDIKGDHITESRKLNRVAPERFHGDEDRGYDIIDNKKYGRLSHEKHLFQPCTKKRQTPWERIQAGHDVPHEISKIDVDEKRDVGYLDSLAGLHWSDGKTQADHAAHARAEHLAMSRPAMKSSSSAPALSVARPPGQTAPPPVGFMARRTELDERSAHGSQQSRSQCSRRSQSGAGGGGQLVETIRPSASGRIVAPPPPEIPGSAPGGIVYSKPK